MNQPPELHSIAKRTTPVPKQPIEVGPVIMGSICMVGAMLGIAYFTDWLRNRNSGDRSEHHR